MPRYWTVLDLVLNVSAYIPLGFIYSFALLRDPDRRFGAVFIACLASFLLSLTVETAQAFLPSRVSSNLDVLANTSGAFLGALLLWAFGNKIIQLFNYLKSYVLSVTQYLEFGLVLIALWLITLLSPETLLFGTGDLRHFVDFPALITYEPAAFMQIESLITATNVVVIGIIVRSIFSKRIPSIITVPSFLAISLIVCTLSSSILIAPQNALDWLTEGAILGLLLGSVLLAIAMLLPPIWRIVLAFLALASSLVFINITAFNPYSLAALNAWQQGSFLNLNGLTRLLSALWPFIAFVYLARVFKLRFKTSH